MPPKTFSSPASQIAAALAGHAEAVCRRYLSRGRKEGRYWLVGDVHNTPGRSLYVRLTASPDGRGAAGKWTDAQSGDHGDLLDVIPLVQGCRTMRETLDEARRFLSLPMPPPVETPPLTDLTGCAALCFHPHCWYRASDEDDPHVRPAWPAMIAAVTDLDGSVTGVHRTWLALDGSDKAPVAYPRRAMGNLLGNAVRFGKQGSVMVAGEGIETMLSLRQVMPEMPAIAGLSAAHLAAIRFPAGLKRLYVARDDDPAGASALKTLSERSIPAGIEIVPLEPRLGDFNDDLMTFGRERIAADLRDQLARRDREHFLIAG